jgi:hypothetical protein
MRYKNLSMMGIRENIKAVIEDKKSKYGIPWINYIFNYYTLLLLLVIIQKDIISTLRRYLNQRRVISSPKEISRLVRRFIKYVVYFMPLKCIYSFLTLLARFILHQLPKNVPFDFILNSFYYLILYMLTVYLINFMGILYPKLPSELNNLFLNYIYKIYRSIYVLDGTLRSNKVFKSFIHITSKLLPYFIPPFGSVLLY